MFEFRWDQYLALVLLSLVFLTPTTQAQLHPQVQSAKINLTQISPLPVLSEKHPDLAASISAKAAVVIDIKSGAILFTKNKDAKVAPASTTKMMTALVARRNFELGQPIVVKYEPRVVGHTVGFKAGQEFAVEEMIKALLISSGNDAAEILAQNHRGGPEGFVDQMNRLAHDLGLENTNFINPSGLDAAAHYSTAMDLSILAREMMKDATLKQFVGTEADVIVDSLGNQLYLYNTNLLLGAEPGVIGVKTGTTDLAGEALVTQVERDDRSLVLIVLGSDDRYTDTKKMIEWIFSYYQWQEV